MKRAFTMLELIFVIVIMGILAKFGVELFKQTYEGYTRSLYINELQTKSANAVQTMANRLTYRIKDSVRSSGITSSSLVRWKGFDIDGWLGNQWSGIVNLDDSNETNLSSPGTLATAAGNEIFFVGSNIGSTLLQYYTVTPGANTLSGTVTNEFSGIDVYEYYQMTSGDHNITRSGTTLTMDGQLLTDDVGTDSGDFLVEKLGDGIHIHLCLEKTGNPLMEGKVCKDKFVF